MMVHVQHASVAGRAVVAPVRLEYVADEAVATTLRLVVAEVEAPERWHLPRITVHGLEEGPYQHQKEHVIDHHK